MNFVEDFLTISHGVEECPETSTRQRATQLGISRRSIQRILAKELMKMFPKTQFVHQVLPKDHQACLDHSEGIINLELEEGDFSSIYNYSAFLMSKSAHIYRWYISHFITTQLGMS